MKNGLIIIGGILIGLLSLSGCEKVITLDLKDSEPRVVIYADISDQTDNQYVRISRTYSFTEPNKFNGATGARVTVTTQGGSVINFSEISPGVYQSFKFRGRSGQSYTLDVTLDGQKYTAISSMPERVTLDSLNFRQVSFLGESSTHIVANFEDPIAVQNQYRYILTIKGTVAEDVVSDDRFNDGKKVSNTVYHELNDLNTGDEIELDLQCIDRNVYRYYFSFGQNQGEGGPPVAPENPPSNFSNGALGIFSVHTSSKRIAKVL